MATDLFDQLATSEVPPPPPQFERRVHERLNRALLFGHLADFVVRAAPSVFVHFAAAVWGFVHFTVFGRYPARRGGNEQGGNREH